MNDVWLNQNVPFTFLDSSFFVRVRQGQAEAGHYDVLRKKYESQTLRAKCCRRSGLDGSPTYVVSGFRRTGTGN